MASLRKLIAHGPSSLTLALPAKWLKKYGLVKGDQVSVQEDELGLRITPTVSERHKRIKMDLSGLDEQSIISILTTAYRRGYDEIVLKYSSGQYEQLSSCVRHLLGLAVVDNVNGVCTIKSLPARIEQDFSSLLRRVFLIILQELEDLEGLLGTGGLEGFHARDADLNSLINLAVRMINKGHINDREQELHLFYTLLQLEEMGDDIARFSVTSEGGKELAPGVKACSALFRKLYEAYFTKRIGIEEFYKKYYIYYPGYPKPEKSPEFFALLCSLGSEAFYLRAFMEKTVSLAEVLLLPKDPSLNASPRK